MSYMKYKENNLRIILEVHSVSEIFQPSDWLRIPQLVHHLTCNYRQDYLNLTMVGQYRKIIKATFLVTKNPGFTDEEFREYYINNHMPLAAGHCQKHGVLEYNVVGLKTN